MIYREIKQNIFKLNRNEYFFAQCISADMAMGAGIALQFNKHFNTKELMLKRYDRSYVAQLWEDTGGECLPCGNVFNLITKKHYWDKPTLESVKHALYALKRWIPVLNTCSIKLAMPKIGCGLDKLKWEDVKLLIFKVFEDTDIDITICSLGDES